MSRKNYVLQGINRHLIVILIVQRISHKLPTDELNLAERPLVGSSRQEVVAIPKTRSNDEEGISVSLFLEADELE
jgi:hypothetical protein